MAKRTKGRRGLEILDTMQNADMELTILAKDFPEVSGVDQKLVHFIQQYGGILLTNDYNLQKVAQLHGVSVQNLNELANVMKPPTFVGEVLHVYVNKEGKEPGQGVGYLEDGTMVVVEEGTRHLGSEVQVDITSILNTAAGRMIFAKLHNGKTSSSSRRRQAGAGARS